LFLNGYISRKSINAGTKIYLFLVALGFELTQARQVLYHLGHPPGFVLANLVLGEVELE
jgi:hypothetical protein